MKYAGHYGRAQNGRRGLKNVAKMLGLPTFDVDMVDSTGWRRYRN